MVNVEEVKTDIRHKRFSLRHFQSMDKELLSKVKLNRMRIKSVKDKIVLLSELLARSIKR